MNRKNGRIICIILVSHFVTLSALGQNSESGKFFVGQNVTLYYEILGSQSGTPLFVINGGPGLDHTYLQIPLHASSAFDELAENYPVILYDQRGVGKSPALTAEQTCTINNQVADLDALRRFLKYDQINLLGHSFGGYLAMAYAALYPERIERLIICDSVAPKWSDTVFLFDTVFPETIEKMDALTVTDETTKRAWLTCLFSMEFYSPENRDAYLADIAAVDFNPQINDMLMKDIDTLNFTQELSKFCFPTLIMTGRFDMNTAPSGAYKIHKTISNSRFVVFEQSGHFPFYEEQEDFVRLVKEFLSDK